MALSPIVEIKKPCYENWDNMNPREKGRFCMSCTKVVTDFTNNTPEEIFTILKQNNNEHNCGHFNSKDVITESKIDKLIWKLNTSGFKYVSLFILGSLILIGCKTRQVRGRYKYSAKNVNDTSKTLNSSITYAGNLKK